MCKICSKIVLKGILCSVSVCWFHERCSKINLNYVKGGNIWVCDLCMKVRLKCLEDKLISKDKVITLLKRDIERLNYALKNGSVGEFLNSKASEGDRHEITNYDGTYYDKHKAWTIDSGGPKPSCREILVFIVLL